MPCSKWLLLQWLVSLCFVQAAQETGIWPSYKSGAGMQCIKKKLHRECELIQRSHWNQLVTWLTLAYEVEQACPKGFAITDIWRAAASAHVSQTAGTLSQCVERLQEFSYIPAHPRWSAHFEKLSASMRHSQWNYSKAQAVSASLNGKGSNVQMQASRSNEGFTMPDYDRVLN